MASIGNSPTQQAFTPAIDYFSGNGSTTAFTLSRPVASVAQVQVTIDNVAQNPSSAYTVSANTITFTSAPLSGTNNIYVYYTSPITQVIAPSQGTVQTAQLGNITNIASGNSSLTLQTGSSPTTAVTINTSQNVGIGTASPTKKLNISGSGSGCGIRIDNTVSGRPTALTYDDSQNLTLFNYSDTGYFAYGNGTGSGTERMRIDSSGNVLVGTTSTPSGATGSIVANSASYIGSNKVVNWTKTNSSNNVTTATVVFQTTSSWFTNYIKFTVSCVQANSANNFAALYLYQVATLDASGGTTRQVLAQGDNAQFTVTVTGNSGTGTQTWTVSVTGPATANRMILTLEAGSALGINATA